MGTPSANGRQRIAIVGSGTTGLATAIGLSDAGHEVTIYERFETAQPIGAGLLLQPTGLACLDKLKLGDTARSLGARIDQIDGQTNAGTIIFDIGYDAMGPDVSGYGMHRGALFAMLNEAVGVRDVPVRCGIEIVGAPLDGEARKLVDRDGNEHGHFDLVLDATGARSRLRARHAAVRLNKPYPYGAVWGVVRDPDGSWTDAAALQQRYVAAHVMVGVLPIGAVHQGGGPPLLAFFWSVPVHEQASWSGTSFDAWRDRVASLWPEAAPLVAQFDGPGHLTWADYADVVLERPTDTRIAFIGDAAHATSPQLGQGANLGLMDAVALVHALETTGSIDEALTRYTKLRRSHVRFYQLASRWMTPFFQSDSTIAATLRDWTLNPMSRVPYLRGEMVRTLAGVKTGVFTSLDTAKWPPLRDPQAHPQTGQPAKPARPAKSEADPDTREKRGAASVSAAETPTPPAKAAASLAKRLTPQEPRVAVGVGDERGPPIDPAIAGGRATPPSRPGLAARAQGALSPRSGPPSSPPPATAQDPTPKPAARTPEHLDNSSAEASPGPSDRRALVDRLKKIP